MRKIILLLSDLLAGEGGESVLRQNLPGLTAMAERGDLAKLEKLPYEGTPEAVLLGMDPSKVSLRQGPLTVAALGADPPDRSTHFHLSLLSLNDGVVEQHRHALPPEQVDLVMARAKLLNTKSLTVIQGEDLDHGLVWEGLGDLFTAQPDEAEGKLYKAMLPAGDNEPALRRFIDDSVNLIGELELNAERIDQGLQPINLLWPWGQGVRQPVPNLALRRGEPCSVMSPSLRLAGLTRLAGYRHGDRRTLGNGMNAAWQEIAESALIGRSTIIYSDSFSRLREDEMLEEASWLANEIDRWVIDPILTSARDVPTRFFVASPSNTAVGLAMSYTTGNTAEGWVPFDERALEEKIPRRGLADWIDALLMP